MIEDNGLTGAVFVVELSFTRISRDDFESGKHVHSRSAMARNGAPVGKILKPVWEDEGVHRQCGVDTHSMRVLELK